MGLPPPGLLRPSFVQLPTRVASGSSIERKTLSLLHSSIV